MNKKRNIFKLLVVLATLALLFFNFNVSDKESVNNESYVSPNTRIHFVDVGQGDSTIVESNGEFMLIDTGENSEWEKLESYINSLNINKFKFVIATHPHADHIGSMSKVIDNYDIENIIMPEVSANTKTFENMANSIINKNINTISPKVGDNYNFGDCSFTIISPYKYSDDLNNNSVGIKLTHGNDKIILMGDCEEIVESEVLNKGADIKADLFKANHHGSSTSNTLNFLKAISPKFVVISCGKDNKYGHPHKEAIENFEAVNSKIYRTDESGDIVFLSTGNGLECIKGAVSGTSLSAGA